MIHKGFFGPWMVSAYSLESSVRASSPLRPLGLGCGSKIELSSALFPASTQSSEPRSLPERMNQKPELQLDPRRLVLPQQRVPAWWYGKAEGKVGKQHCPSHLYPQHLLPAFQANPSLAVGSRFRELSWCERRTHGQRLNRTELSDDTQHHRTSELGGSWRLSTPTAFLFYRWAN